MVRLILMMFALPIVMALFLGALVVFNIGVAK